MKKEEIKEFVKENKGFFASCATIGALAGLCLSLAIRNKELGEYAAGMRVKEVWTGKFDNGGDGIELLRYNGTSQFMKPRDEVLEKMAS